MVVVEPRTIAGLPLQSTHDAEFRRATASHVIATFMPFDHGVAAVTALPTFLLSLFNEFGNFGIFRTINGFVHFGVTKGANFRFATWACGEFAAFK